MTRTDPAGAFVLVGLVAYTAVMLLGAAVRTMRRRGSGPPSARHVRFGYVGGW